jgi:hypothetical protein
VANYSNPWPLEAIPTPKKWAGIKAKVEAWCLQIWDEIPTGGTLTVVHQAHEAKEDTGETEKHTWGKHWGKTTKVMLKYNLTQTEYIWETQTSWGLKINVRIYPWRRNHLHIRSQTDHVDMTSPWSIRRFADTLEQAKGRGTMWSTGKYAVYQSARIGQEIELSINKGIGLTKPEELIWGLISLCKRVTLEAVPVGDLGLLLDAQPYRRTTFQALSPDRNRKGEVNPDRYYTRLEVGYTTRYREEGIVAIDCPWYGSKIADDLCQIISVETHHREGRVYMDQDICNKCVHQLACLAKGQSTSHQAVLTSSQL